VQLKASNEEYATLNNELVASRQSLSAGNGQIPVAVRR
jgi:hypothetical protein